MSADLRRGGSASDRETPDHWRPACDRRHNDRRPGRQSRRRVGV